MAVKPLHLKEIDETTFTVEPLFNLDITPEY